MDHLTFDRIVLHALRLGGPAEVEDIESRTGVNSTVVGEVLASAQERGWVVHRSGVLHGWLLTGDGRRAGELLLARELDEQRGRAQLESLYVDFLPLNKLLLAVCADWQTVRLDDREVVNDHADAERDATVLERLGDLHEVALSLIRSLTEVLDRFDEYGRRLSLAHERIAGGDTDWLTKSTIDSYHTIWFELHEDLLATLGRRRVDEK